MAEAKRMTTDSYRELLHIQAVALKDAVDRCERAERRAARLQTDLHWAERQLAHVRHQATRGPQAVSEALRGLDGHTTKAPEPEPMIRPFAGDEAVMVPAIVDMDAQAVLNHLAARHEPSYFHLVHTSSGLRIQHDSSHVLGKDVIRHTHKRSRRKVVEDDGD